MASTRALQKQKVSQIGALTGSYALCLNRKLHFCLLIFCCILRNFLENPDLEENSTLLMMERQGSSGCGGEQLAPLIEGQSKERSLLVTISFPALS